MGKSIAIAVDSKSKDDWKKVRQIRDYNVVIITHSKYKQLLLDRQQYRKLTEGKENLIIDEEISIVDILNRGTEYFELYTKALPYNVEALYNKCIDSLRKAIQLSKSDESKLLEIEFDALFPH